MSILRPAVELCLLERGKKSKPGHHIYQSLKSRLSCFTVKLVIITNEMNEFAIVIEVTRLSCDGLVIIAQSRLYFRTPEAWVEAINALVCWQIKFILRKQTYQRKGPWGRQSQATFFVRKIDGNVHESISVHWDVMSKEVSKIRLGDMQATMAQKSIVIYNFPVKVMVDLKYSVGHSGITLVRSIINDKWQ